MHILHNLHSTPSPVSSKKQLFKSNIAMSEAWTQNRARALRRELTFYEGELQGLSTLCNTP